MQGSSPIPYVDHRCTLPDSLFPARQRAWCAFFVQDAKLTRAGIKTCEFGTGLSSQWSEGLHAQPWEKAVSVINQHGTRVWLMTTEEQVRTNAQQAGAQAVLPQIQRALKQSKGNISSCSEPTRKQPFPTHYDKTKQFDPYDIGTYYAVGISPYMDLPAEHFADITGAYPQSPRILMLDEGVTGPLPCITNYKHMTRLVLSSCAGQEHNPDFVIIELTYRPDLARFLRTKFPDSQRLVLKAVASSRGEGVVMLDASTEKTLDEDLQHHLKPKAPFHEHSVLSICLIEDFVYAPENSEADRFNETLLRVANLAIYSRGQLELSCVSATRSFEDPSQHLDKHSHGIVKIAKNNDGRHEQLSQPELEKLSRRQFTAIRAFAQRAINYDRQAAIAHFLASESHVMNLMGLEFLNPSLSYSYRERVEPGQGLPSYQRVTREQCRLCLRLLKRNHSPSVRRLILQNIVLPELQAHVEAPYRAEAPELALILESLVAEQPQGLVAAFLRAALVENYKNLHRGFNPDVGSLKLQTTGLKLFSRQPQLSSRVAADGFQSVLEILPFVMPYQQGKDYLSEIRQLALSDLTESRLQSLRKALGQHGIAENRSDYCLYRYLLRLKRINPTASAVDWPALATVLNSHGLSMLWMLPEAHKLAWTPQQLAALVNGYYRQQGAEDNFDFFGPYVRFFGQCTGIDGQLAHRFCLALAQFEVAPLLLIQLQRHLIDRVLLYEEPVNQLLQRVLGCLCKQSARSAEDLHSIIQQLTGV